MTACEAPPVDPLTVRVNVPGIVIVAGTPESASEAPASCAEAPAAPIRPPHRTISGIAVSPSLRSGPERHAPPSLRGRDAREQAQRRAPGCKPWPDARGPLRWARAARG